MDGAPNAVARYPIQFMRTDNSSCAVSEPGSPRTNSSTLQSRLQRLLDPRQSKLIPRSD